MADDGGIESPKRGKKKGPHVERRLNAAFVPKAPPGRHTDGGGLYLVVDPSGARRWLLRIVVQGSRKDIGLGSANLFKLSEAREKALEYRRLARLGLDPTKKEQATERTGKKTFEELATEYHRDFVKARRSNGKHIDQWINTLRSYVFPVIGKMSLGEIGKGDIVRAVQPIWFTKKETARRVLQRIETVLGYASGVEIIDASPNFKEIKFALGDQEKKVKHFSALGWRDVGSCYEKVEGVSGIGSAALRFTILTAMRSGPVRNATWDEFRADFWEWHIPAQKMKMREEFMVPLSSAARDIVVRLHERRRPGCDLVFSSPSKPDQPISENTMAKVLKSFYPDKTVHGMRSAFRGWASVFAGARGEVAEFALAHGNPNKVESVYLREKYEEERKELMAVWGEYLTNAESYQDAKSFVSYKKILDRLNAEVFSDIDDDP